MTLDCGLEGAAEHLGIHLSQGRLAEIQAVLDTDLASMEPYADALAGIELLQSTAWPSPYAPTSLSPMVQS